MGDGAAPAEPERARGDYARTKAAAELLALAADAPGFAVTAVRPHIVWGPGDPQLVARVQERARQGRLPIVGTGAALVDTCYIDDAVAGIRRRARPDRAWRTATRTCSPRGSRGRSASCSPPSAPPRTCRRPRRHVPTPLAVAVGAVAELVWRIRPGEDEPPMTRFLAEQLSTAHWFDQRRTRRDLDWVPEVGVTRGLQRLAAASA